MKCNFFILILLCLVLQACASNTQTVVEYKTISVDIPLAERKEMPKLEDIKVNPDQSGNIVISEDDFKKIMYNMLVMKNQIIHYKNIIIYYEDNIKALKKTDEEKHTK